MKHRRYQLIFRGEINASAELDVVKQHLAQVLQTPSQCVDSMFALSETCVRSGLRQETAQKLKDHLQQQTGAKFLIVPEDAEPDLPASLRAAEVVARPTQEVCKKKTSNHKKAIMIASIFSLFCTLSIGMQFWASHTAEHMNGSSLLLIHNKTTYIISHHHLLQIDMNTNQLIKKTHLNKLGIQGNVSDMAIDQQGGLWLADIKAQHIIRCPLSTLKCQTQIDLNEEHKISNKHHSLPESFVGQTPSDSPFFFQIVKDMDHIYVTETAHSCVRMFNFKGKELLVSDPKLMLPRHMIWQKKKLLVADWGQQRIAVLGKFDMDLKKEWKLNDSKHYVDEEERFNTDLTDVEEVIEQSLALLAGMNAPKSPIQIISDRKKGYWVLSSNPLFNRFQLLHLNQQHHIDHRYDIPSQQALSMAMLNAHEILITDDSKMQFLKFDSTSEKFTAFIYPQLQKDLEEKHQERENYRQLSEMITYLLYTELCLGLILIGLGFRSRIKRKKTAP
ncbi:MAG: hypothetical protein Q9M28_03610 [Mariprofundaceae bacterium]|nr:hypothetical protein [Mariprofundaceae bacterium]